MHCSKDLKDNLLFLREAIQYINYFNKKIFVIEVNSYIIADKKSFRKLIQDLILLNHLGVRVVLIHGINHYLKEKMNHGVIEQIDAKRIHQIKQVCGLVKFDIENCFSLGSPVFGSVQSRAKVVSGNWICARPTGIVNGIDMLHIGKVRNIDIDNINLNLANNNIVLISPLGFSLSGEIYYLPLAEVTSQIAIKLHAEKLIFITRSEGVLDKNGKIFNQLSYKEAIHKVNLENQHEDIKEIYPAVIQAIEKGINRVQVISGIQDGSLLIEVYSRLGIGTSIARKSFDNIRKAEQKDIPALLKLIEPLIEKEILLDRDSKYIENKLSEFYVLQNDEIIYGCVSITEYLEKKCVELGCLAILKKSQYKGYGERLLEFVIEYAKEKQVEFIFALTTQAKDWFLERNFIEADPTILPLERLQIYIKTNRKSEILKLDLNSH